MMAPALGVLLAVSVLGVVGLAGGAPGLLYLVLFVLALLPGLPLGWLVFGRRHPAGWAVGGLLGYFITALSIWGAIAAHSASGRGFVVWWLIASAAVWLAFWRTRPPLVQLTPWTRRDTTALLLVLLLVPAIAGPPFARLGAGDREGNRYYRAYFTADFVWHTALTAEISKYSSPPQNPFLAGRPIHYYWTYYLLPAAVSGSGPAALSDVERNLKVNAIATALLLVTAVFMAAWAAFPSGFAVSAAVALAILASSAEGLYAVLRLWSSGEPLSAVREMNIDAISNWWFAGLRVDGLARCFWWVPQHSMAYALGLAGFTVVNAAGSGASLAAIAVAGVALGGAVAFNPFVGGIFCLAYGGGVLVHALTTSDPLRRVVRHTVAVLPVVAALAWCSYNQMFEGAGGVLTFGLERDPRNNPFVTLALSLGPALLPVVAGLAIAWRVRTAPAAPLTRSVAPLCLVLLSLVVMHFVRLSVDTSWVGFRAGQMLLVAVPALAARGLAAARPWRTVAIAVAAVALLAGTPTTAIDLYNAQDISNTLPGPGFPWTQVLDRPHRDALEWLRRATFPNAIVQEDALARHRTTWWVVPTFAQRRMAGALPPFMMDMPEYHEKSERVRAMYATADAREAWMIARELGIDYIYVDEVERRAYADGMAKFQDGRYFAPAFLNDAVQVYNVHR